MMELLRTYLIALRNTIRGFNLLKLPLVFTPKKLLECTQAEIFFFKTLTGRRGLSQRNVADVLGQPKGPVDIRLALPGKWLAPDSSYTKDLISLCLLCRILRPQTVFEIGTLDGYTAYHLALNTPDEARIFTLDLPARLDSPPALSVTWMDRQHITASRSFDRLAFQEAPEEKKITRLYGDSARFDFSPYLGKIDLFFIDGAHSYDYVRSDSLQALRCIKKGGVVAWHDYGRAGLNGVSRFLHEMVSEHEIYSVPGSSLAFMIGDK